MAPRLPKEQSSFTENGTLSLTDAVDFHRSGLLTGAQSGSSGHIDVQTQGARRFGDLNQNRTTIRNVHHR